MLIATVAVDAAVKSEQGKCRRVKKATNESKEREKERPMKREGP